MTAETDDDDDPVAGLPLTVELAIDDAGLAGRVRAMLASAPDITVVGGDWPPARVRITAGTAGIAENAPVLMLAGAGDADGPTDATGIVSADIDAAALCAAVRAAAQGLAVFSPRFRAADIEDRDTRGLARAEDEQARVDLTPRELEVLQLLAEGASNKVIARRLDITPHTAKFHVASIVGKLGASGRTDAVARAMRLGLVMI